MKQYTHKRSPRIRKVIESPPNLLVRYGTTLVIVIFTIVLLFFMSMLSIDLEAVLDSLLPLSD